MLGLKQLKDITPVLGYGPRVRKKCGHPDGENAWEKWWKVSESGDSPKHIYFMGKDNIPFHTIIWPAIIMGLNAADSNAISHKPLSGHLALEFNVSATEYLMLRGAIQ